MSDFATSKFIYTDKCNEEVRNELVDNLRVGVIVRNEEEWDIGYITMMMTNPSLEVVVINNIDERSIAEMTLAAFMCKKILVTSKSISQYPHIYSFVSEEHSSSVLK